MKVILGFDPGGKGRFGWAVCTDLDEGLKVVNTGLADHAKGALEQSLKAIPRGGELVCAGIDAPLFWIADGDRQVDQLVRKAIKDRAKSPGGTVQQVNSLQGACVIQGLLILKLLRQTYPDLPITEAHPKALLWLKGIARRGRSPKQVGLQHINEVIIDSSKTGLDDGNQDKRDAVLGALTAQMMIRKNSEWINLLTHEKAERILAENPPIEYWMPKIVLSLANETKNEY